MERGMNTDPNAPVNHKLRLHLIRLAVNGATITYGECGKMIGMNIVGNNFAKEIGLILGAIARYEHEADRPILTAVVVRTKPHWRPGDGFLRMASEVQRYQGPDTMDSPEGRAFWEHERDAVYVFWQNALKGWE